MRWNRRAGANVSAPAEKKPVEEPTDGTASRSATSTLPGIPREADGERVPNGLFDAAFYSATYPDAAASGLTMREHYAQIGRAAGYAPSLGATYLAEAIRQRATVSSTPMADILELFPNGQRHRLKEGRIWERLRSSTHPRFYAAQLPAAEVPEGGFDLEGAVAHFLAHGAHLGARIGALFNPDWYVERFRATGEEVPSDARPFFHWLTLGWRAHVVPTPLFDEEYYVTRHPAAARRSSWAFAHYLRVGCYQSRWIPSPGAYTHGVVDPDAATDRSPLLLREALHRADEYDLTRTSWLEEGTLALLEKGSRLRSPRMQELIAKAAAIEPLIHHHPPGERALRYPPHRHPLLLLKDRCEDVRRRLGITHVDTVMLVPQARATGSTRVAAELSRALRAVDPDASVLVVATDAAELDRRDWFDPSVRVLDVAGDLQDLEFRHQLAMVLDVVRGLTPRRIINVNSKLGWELFTAYGRQLSAAASLGAYLFTWDLDADGHRRGYPIRAFQHNVDQLDWVLLDNDALRQELVDRYGMPESARRRLVVAKTPLAVSDVDLSGTFATRRLQGRPLRALWAGRMDRQKRFDVVIELARLRPDLEIWAWGAPVLGGGPDLEDLPSNIVLKGVYASFDDLPLREVDLMLYTSEWDGIPTILLDGAQRGLPVVASAVGGVPEVLDESTGYLVSDALDPKAYLVAIDRLVGDPQDATARSSAARARITEEFSDDRYFAAVRSALDLPRRQR